MRAVYDMEVVRIECQGKDHARGQGGTSWGGVGWGEYYLRGRLSMKFYGICLQTYESYHGRFFYHFTTLSLLLSFGKSSYSPVPSVLPWVSIGRVGIPIKCMRLMSSLFLKDAATKLGHIWRKIRPSLQPWGVSVRTPSSVGVPTAPVGWRLSLTQCAVTRSTRADSTFQKRETILEFYRYILAQIFTTHFMIEQSIARPLKNNQRFM